MISRLVPALCGALFLVGCPSLEPTLLETRLVSDTNVTEGGYEVQTLVRDLSGVARARILYTGIPVEQTVSTSGESPMREAGSSAEQDADRWVGVIPSGFPIGTTVRYAVEVCNRMGRCTLEPAGWPNSEAFSFVVGTLPSQPFVTRVTPARGPSTGGIRVEVEGLDFRPGMLLFFDQARATHVEVIRSTLALCTLPPHEAGVVDVTAQNPDNQEGTLRKGFTYYQAPRVIRVTPPEGPTAGGTFVVIEGEFFIPEARVTFEGRHARHVVVHGDTVISCETPPGNPGFADVAVIHPEGGEGVLEDGYRYIPPPIVDGVIPPDGPDFGGQEVVVTGENFIDGATVTVGGAPCVDVEFISSEELRCTVPPGTPGAADVTVTNPDGQSGTLLGGYYYNGPPVVVAVDPDEGPLVAGQEAIIYGAGFLGGMTVSIGGRPAVVLGDISRDRAHVQIPAAAEPINPPPPDGTRPVDVSVTNPAPDGRSATLQNGYTYVWPPEVTSVEPDRGPTQGGTAVVVRGRFFRSINESPLVVRFDTPEVAALQVISNTELRMVTPPGDPGFADIGVRNHPLSEGVGLQLYLYVPPPDPQQVIPPDGPTFGGDVVTIIGEWFQPGATVTFDGAPCTNVQVSADGTTITCTTPPGERGPADVVVTNPDGQRGELPAGYTYLPLVVRPDGGFEAGFTRTRLFGAGMHPGVAVFFGTTQATIVQHVSEREIVVESPPHGLGAVDVSFRNADGTGETAEAAFTYRTLADRSNGRMPLEFRVGNDGEAADVDGDGDLDVMVANGGVDQADISALYRNQTVSPGAPSPGSFSEETLGPILTTNQVSFGDVNGDNRPDLLFAASQESHFFLNDGSGNFVEQLMVNDGDGAFEGVIVDLSGDGVKDIFLLNIGCSEGNDPNCPPDIRGRDTLLINVGGGAFDDRSNVVPHALAEVHDHKLETWDLNGDGRLDLIITVDNKNFEGANGRPNHRVLLSQPGGGYSDPVFPPDFSNIIGDVYGIAIGDLDGDGRPDLALPSYHPDFVGALGFQGTPGSHIILLGGQGANFTRDDTRLDTGIIDEPTINTVIYDMDEDGDLDVFYLNLGEVPNRLYINRGDGFFVYAPTALPSEARQTTDVVPGDFDLDGDVDLVVINQDRDQLLLAGPEL
ncbi:MAG: IPT/TIG domain-containing protein [Myxococcota bacterium]